MSRNDIRCHASGDSTTRKIGFGIGVLIVTMASIAQAHDYWLEQDAWVLAPGDTCTVRLLVGDELDAELERPLQYEWTTRYEWHTGEQVLQLADLPDGLLPVFTRPRVELGPSLLVMDRGFVPIESTVGGFLKFLEHEDQEGLGAVYEGVAPGTPLTRRYARAIKALITVGATESGDLHSKTLGQQIEIRLLQDPHALELGATFKVHVRFGGDDLASQVIRALVRQKDGGVSIQSGRTNESGQTEFRLDRKGIWMIRVAHIRQCTDCQFDWDTHYATFSFVVP